MESLSSTVASITTTLNGVSQFQQLLEKYNQNKENQSDGKGVTAQPSRTYEIDYYIVMDYIAPVLYALIAIFGIVGNSVVIYVIASKKNMQTATNILLLNLAITDLLFLAISPLCTAVTRILNYWPFGNVVCKLMHYIINLTAYVTVYTLVLFAAIRYMTIVHHQKTVRIRTQSNVAKILIGVWLIMMFFNIPIFFSYGTIYFPEHQVEDCEPIRKGLVKVIMALWFALGYVFPLLAIATLSLAIVAHIKAQASLVSTRVETKNRKRNACRLLMIVVVMFAVCWLPIHIVLLWAHFGVYPLNNKVAYTIYILANPICYLNSSINPVIYNIYSKDFKKAFHDILHCLCCKKATEADSLQMKPVGKSTLVSKLSPLQNGKHITNGRNPELKDIIDPKDNGFITSANDVTLGLMSHQDCEGDVLDIHAPGAIYIGEITKAEFHTRKMSYERKDSCKQ